MYELILKGGRIYDGSGLPSFNGDVAISNGRIQEIGHVEPHPVFGFGFDRLRCGHGIRSGCIAMPCGRTAHTASESGAV